MASLKSDVIETYYFFDEDSAQRSPLTEAVGYVLTVDGILKHQWGEETKFPFVLSTTTVKD